MKILCVIVLYNCKLFEAVSYVRCVKKGLNNRDIGLFVYDNSPIPQHQQDEFKDKRIAYISDTQNSGVSRAYNQGAIFAKENGFDWMVLFDQDTDFQDEAYLENVYKEVEHSSYPLLVPLVVKHNNNEFSPLPAWHHIPQRGKYRAGKAYSLSNVAIINSGMIINVESFFDVGGYNDKIPLDLSDYQFIDRLKTKYSHFYLMDYKLVQSFSNDVDGVKQLKRRYKTYCLGCVNYEADFVSKIDMHILMIRRCLSLIIKTKKLVFFNILIKSYLKR